MGYTILLQLVAALLMTSKWTAHLHCQVEVWKCLRATEGTDVVFGYCHREHPTPSSTTPPLISWPAQARRGLLVLSFLKSLSSQISSPQGRGGPPQERPGQPGASVHTQLLGALQGLHPSSPPGALSGLQGPGKNDREAGFTSGP